MLNSASSSALSVSSPTFGGNRAQWAGLAIHIVMAPRFDGTRVFRDQAGDAGAPVRRVGHGAEQPREIAVADALLAKVADRR